MKKFFATMLIAILLSIQNVESQYSFKTPPPIILRFDSPPRINPIPLLTKICETTYLKPSTFWD